MTLPGTLDPIDIVRTFLEGWRDSPQSMVAAIEQFFTPDTVYENVGVSITTGPADAARMIERYCRKVGQQGLEIEILQVAATSGGMVLTERVDRLVDAQRRVIHEGRCMGIFEVRERKILAWRDYFDTAAFAQI